jgi:hypothetical protein
MSLVSISSHAIYKGAEILPFFGKGNDLEGRGNNVRGIM